MTIVTFDGGYHPPSKSDAFGFFHNFVKNAKETSLAKTRENLKEESSKYATAHARMNEMESQSRATQRELQKLRNSSTFKEQSLEDKLKAQGKKYESEIDRLNDQVNNLQNELNAVQEESNQFEHTQHTIGVEKDDKIVGLEQKNEQLQFQLSKSKQHENSGWA